MSNYETWHKAVAAVLAGHGFLNPSAHMKTVDGYCRSAFDFGMSHVQCANNIVKAHQQGRTLRGAR
jgi:hypothetical protein